MLDLLVKGLLIGFAIAAPVGPIGVLCIQRTLHDGFKVGLMTGLGAALADGSYGLIAGLGLTTVSSMLIGYRWWIQIIGGLFLLYLGIKLFLSKPRERSTQSYDRSSWHAFGTTFLLTLANPITILSFIAVFAGLGLGTVNASHQDAIMLVIGVTLGSAIWWIMLSSGVAFVLHKRVNNLYMRLINCFSGVIILAFGIYSLKIIF